MKKGQNLAFFYKNARKTRNFQKFEISLCNFFLNHSQSPYSKFQVDIMCFRCTYVRLREQGENPLFLKNGQISPKKRPEMKNSNFFSGFS